MIRAVMLEDSLHLLHGLPSMFELETKLREGERAGGGALQRAAKRTRSTQHGATNSTGRAQRACTRGKTAHSTHIARTQHTHSTHTAHTRGTQR